MARWLGVDYGRKRIGLAISDPGESLASPAKVLDGTGAVTTDAMLVVRWATANEIDSFVVGMPFNMDGSSGSQAQLTKQFVAELARLSCAPVELWDERLSSFQADEYMLQAGIKRTRRKTMRDALAAQVILQSFLDAGRSDQPSNDAL